MKPSRLPLHLLSQLALAVVILSFTPRVALAQPSTEDKVQMMSSALQARDRGDYAAAKQLLQKLQTAAPNDATLQRLLRELDQKIATQAAAAAQARAAAVDEAAEAIARAETDRLRGLLTDAEHRRKAARALAREQRFEEALVALGQAQDELPLNPLTQSTVDEIRAEKASLLLQQGRQRLQAGDLTGSRLSLANYRTLQPDDELGDTLAKEIDRAEARIAANATVQASAPVVSVSTGPADTEALLARARSQYVAGAPAAALETFREVLDQDPGNREAGKFIERIDRELAAAPGQARTVTRRELLAEVDRSWQRPQVHQEQAKTEREAGSNTALWHKLNAIVLPNVSFTKVGIGRVVSALSAASEEFDSSASAPKGVNVVLLDPSNKNPEVTLTLRNTNLKRVLDFVTQAVGYQYEVQTDAVVVRPGGESTTLDTEFFAVSRATVLRMTGSHGSAAAAKSSDPFSSIGASNEAAPGSEAPAMQAFLQQAGVNFTGTPGSSLAYDGSSIIVTQTARNLERIRNILNRYNDIRQVEIEAKFMEVQEGTLEELGVNWSVTTKTTQRNAGAQAAYQTSGRTLANAFNSNITSQQGSIISPAVPTVFNDANGNGIYDVGETITQQGREAINLPIINNAPQIPGTAYLGSGANALANVTGVIGEFDVNAVVRALSQKQGTDLLSAPKVTVLSGNPATITVAQELRYPQSFGQTQSQVGTGSASGGGSAGVAITAGTPQEFTTRNVGVELKVTPTVEEDDYSISLDLNPKVTEFDGFVEYGGPSVAISGSTTVNVPSGFYQPIFSVRDISTKVTIWDGATLIMGGLTREEVKKVNDKVPVLGDIPLLGHLFRSKGESAQKRNLLIFVTANLLSPGGSPKKQVLRGVAPSSLFQNPVLVTPGGAEARTEEEN